MVIGNYEWFNDWNKKLNPDFDNLKLSKAKNTIRAYKSDFNDLFILSKHGMKSMPTDLR